MSTVRILIESTFIGGLVEAKLYGDPKEGLLDELQVGCEFVSVGIGRCWAHSMPWHVAMTKTCGRCRQARIDAGHGPAVRLIPAMR